MAFRPLWYTVPAMTEVTPEEAAAVRPPAPETAADVVCHVCRAALTPVFEPEATKGQEERYQFDNALWVEFPGGYAMFTDDFGVSGPDRARAVLCHDCAHELCVAVPWIGALLEPASSHSHRTQFWAENPDHDGWDTPTR